ncbi:MAG: tRNA dihydrouridine synthase DusB [Mobiluncus porci]|uniref:tRNA dihydrouridine synthase DusB n=1 Tax=Mobiluncus porci TaxID=2652278 RepID=UPI0023F52FD2|nr:tRNA dihydrouridine synthase DusB [Mobiluncus porci]MDD7540838.1 tRNA dihydrouridine synthase DusB [Mobiluncus porci]MDY5749202.1 tRNA dihydrouridine synthase DusB [Mobiluncus porci]
MAVCKVPQLRIGGLTFATPVALAPMADVTNAPFRDLCLKFSREGLPVDFAQASHERVDSDSAGSFNQDVPSPLTQPEGMFVGEMVTAKALRMGSARSWVMVKSGPLQAIRSIQLYGVVAADLAWAARELVRRDFADHIDLNFGCPVPKVTRKGGGSALPWKTSYFGEIVAAVVEATSRTAEESGRTRAVPVTVKIRTGIDAEHLTYLDAARTAEDNGAAAVTLHARTTSEYYGGHSHWEAIARLVEAVDIPVLGNGDVFSAADAVEMFEQTGCAGIQVGRAVQGRPWILREITAALWGEPVPPGPTLGEIVAVAQEHAAGLVEHYGNELAALRDMRKHLGWYFRGFGLGGETRSRLAKVETLGDLEMALTELVDRLSPDTPYPQAATGTHGRSRTQRKVRLPEGWLDSREIDDAAREILHLDDGSDPYAS